MSHISRSKAFAVAALFMLAGCGNSGTAAEPAPADSRPAQPVSAPAAEQPRNIAGLPAFSPTPTMLEIVEQRQDSTVVRHEFGEVEIPRNPKRVYADISGFPIAAFVGLDLAGVDYYTGADQQPWFAALVGDADARELTGDVDVERVAALKPDLILASNVVRDHTGKKPADIYAQLSRIAPTVVFNDDAFSYWEQASLDLGTALGQTDVERKTADFHAQLGPACAPLREAIGEETVETLNIFGTDYWIQGPGTTTAAGSFAPVADTRWLFDYCGLQPPASLTQATTKESFAQVSAELLPQVDAEHLFVITADAEAEQGRAQLLANPLWKDLPAVKAGQVYFLPRLSATNAAESLDTISQAATAIESTR